MHAQEKNKTYKIAYAEVGTIYGFRHSLGVLEHTLCREGGLLFNYFNPKILRLQ